MHGHLPVFKFMRRKDLRRSVNALGRDSRISPARAIEDGELGAVFHGAGGEESAEEEGEEVAGGVGAEFSAGGEDGGFDDDEGALFFEAAGELEFFGGEVGF